jgi:hypothetical protein
MIMNAVRAYYNGHVFVPVEPVKAKQNQSAIITILDDERNEEKPHMRFFGVFSKECLDAMEEALKETERIDPDDTETW